MLAPLGFQLWHFGTFVHWMSERLAVGAQFFILVVHKYNRVITVRYTKHGHSILAWNDCAVFSCVTLLCSRFRVSNPPFHEYIERDNRHIHYLSPYDIL